MICEDCPPPDYPTQETRCLVCPRRPIVHVKVKLAPSERLQCCVPFCKRTRGDWKGDPVAQYSEWICAIHWRMVDRQWRRTLKKIETRLRERGLLESRLKVFRFLWERCKSQAIERAMGMKA